MNATAIRLTRGILAEIGRHWDLWRVKALIRWNDDDIEWTKRYIERDRAHLAELERTASALRVQRALLER